MAVDASVDITMRIAISGAGVAGAALAHWLQRTGHTPTVIEQAPHFRTGGYMIDFWGAGYQVAKRMGIDDAIRAAGYQIDWLRSVGSRGELSYVLYNIPGRLLGRVALRGDRTMFLFIFRAQHDSTSETPKDQLRNQFGDGGWERREILATLEDVDDLYFDVVSQATFAGGHVTRSVAHHQCGLQQPGKPRSRWKRVRWGFAHRHDSMAAVEGWDRPDHTENTLQPRRWKRQGGKGNWRPPMPCGRRSPASARN